jgi:lactoylglutathione lyase
MLRVGDLQRSIDFYTLIIGMRVLRTYDQPDEKYTLKFLGFSEESTACVLELTYNYGVSSYEIGHAYGHIAISVDDCSKACGEIKEKGGNIVLEPKSFIGTNEIIAFVTDPDGYKIELIQRT